MQSNEKTLRFLVFVHMEQKLNTSSKHNQMWVSWAVWVLEDGGWGGGVVPAVVLRARAASRAAAWTEQPLLAEGCWSPCDQTCHSLSEEGGRGPQERGLKGSNGGAGCLDSTSSSCSSSLLQTTSVAAGMDVWSLDPLWLVRSPVNHSSENRADRRVRRRASALLLEQSWSDPAAAQGAKVDLSLQNNW